MSRRETQKAKEIIATLEQKGFYAECPCCSEQIRLRDCGLFYLDDFTPEAEETYARLKVESSARKAEIEKRRKHISATSEIGAKAVNMGFILERLAPSLASFRFSRNDCRSLFDPIDYIIFEGLSSTGVVSNIIFADIKTGAATLKSNQREIKSLVQSGNVELKTYSSENLND
jgi:predicted Holliday junction resolvase-like endonuclease